MISGERLFIRPMFERDTIISKTIKKKCYRSVDAIVYEAKECSKCVKFLIVVLLVSRVKFLESHCLWMVPLYKLEDVQMLCSIYQNSTAHNTTFNIIPVTYIVRNANSHLQRSVCDFLLLFLYQKHLSL